MDAAIRAFRLHYGVDFEGGRHHDVELGPVSVSMYLQLSAQRPPDNGASDEDRVRYTCKGLAARIRKLGDIPRPSITAELLMSSLQMPDLDLLLAHAEALDGELDRFRRGIAAGAEADPAPGVRDRVGPC